MPTDFGTLLFALDGGASTCQWEVGTVHRAAPTFAWEYIGPEKLHTDEPALFKLAVGNSVGYYENGAADSYTDLETDPLTPSEPKKLSKPGFTSTDAGYTPLDFDLSVANQINGLDLGLLGQGGFGTWSWANGEMGKGITDLLLTVTWMQHTSLGKYEFDAPVMVWAQDCGDGIPGEGFYNYKNTNPDTALPYSALRMPGVSKGKGIKFTPPCPPIKWSGDILSANNFVYNKANKELDKYITIEAVVGDIDVAKRPFAGGLELEYRYLPPARRGGVPGDWKSTQEPFNDLAPDLSGAHPWDVLQLKLDWKTVGTDLEDGDYEIRIRGRCVALSSDPRDAATTVTIKGMVDLTPPKFVGVYPIRSPSLAQALSTRFTAFAVVSLCVCSQVTVRLSSFNRFHNFNCG